MMVRTLYSFVMWLLQPLVRRKLLRRARAEPGYGEHIEERFGVYAGASHEVQGSKRHGTIANAFIWVHAVSLGETRAAAPLITELRKALPGMRLLLTHGTATGRAQGRSLLQDGDVQVWQPWDTAGAVHRFLAHFQPRIGLLVETEVWPNMAAACVARGIPLCLVNARMNAQSLARARSLAWLARPAYGALRAVWAQAQPDAERLAALGAPVRGVFGNFKFDATPDAQQWKTGRDWHDALGRPVAVLANSRDGEELMFLESLKNNRALAHVNTAQDAIDSVANHEIQWLLVPRHPQRFDEVAALCTAQGFSVSRRSQWLSGPQDADIWLGDSLGEMAMYYALADVALLGGSFAPLGGHNLIEATACECPVLMGPHTFNFAQAAELAMAAGAAFAYADLPHAMDQALVLLRSGPDLNRARQAARDLGRAHRGAALLTCEAVQKVLRRQL